MKVKKWVDLSEEVEIDIGVDDVRIALAEAFADVATQPTEPFSVLLAFSNIGTFFRAISDEQINRLNADQRKIIGKWLAEQASRFATPESVSTRSQNGATATEQTQAKKEDM